MDRTRLHLFSLTVSKNLLSLQRKSHTRVAPIDIGIRSGVAAGNGVDSAPYERHGCIYFR